MADAMPNLVAVAGTGCRGGSDPRSGAAGVACALWSDPGARSWRGWASSTRISVRRRRGLDKGVPS